MRILKFMLQIRDGEQPLPIPVGSRVVAVAMQRGFVCLWAVVTSEIHDERRFEVFGTGHKARGEYVGTAFDGPNFVWHVFEV